MYCETHKLIDRLEIIRDEGISDFKSTNRHGYQRIVAEGKAGRVDKVITYDLSRLSRSVRETLFFIEEIVQKKGVGLVSLAQNLDTSTLHGMAFISMVSVMNQLYRDEVSFKTKMAFAHKRSKGERASGQLPYGFEDRDGVMVENLDEQAVLTNIRALRFSGLSLREIASHLDVQGVPTKNRTSNWSPKVVRDLLKRGVTHEG